MELVEVTVPAEGWQGRQRLSPDGARSCAEVLRDAPVWDGAPVSARDLRRIGTVESARPVGDRVACLVALHEPLPEGTRLGLDCRGTAARVQQREEGGRREWVLDGPITNACLVLIAAPGAVPQWGQRGDE